MQIILGDSLEKLKELEDNSVDSIVTDPPYELGFMGKGWDKSGIANNVELWSECLRVLKPGGHLLAFSGTRTYHRMAVAIEDAGFEVRDMIEWVYGSGFPKSLNIGKAVDKLQGNEREITGTRIAHDIRGGALMEATDPNLKKENNKIEVNITKGTSEWEGWGTALKPSHEPICMARKPITEKNIAENVLKWGVGGINIDESRVEAKNGDKFGGGGLNSPTNGFMGNTENTYKKGSGFRDDTHIGRFPANLIHDNSEEVRECFPESKGALAPVKAGLENKLFGVNKPTVDNGKSFRNDNGNASRFFKSILYYPKASKKERNMGCEGLPTKQIASMATANGTSNEPSKGMERFQTEPKSNHHPTVKPIALMEYLIKMVTPKGGIVLDPFMGSGSTGVAAKKNGYDFIGIDMTPEYVEIAKARINATEIENRLI